MSELEQYQPLKIPGGYACRICPDEFLARTQSRAHSEVIAHLRHHRKNELYAERQLVLEALR